jgi:hypothetical protein
MEENNSNKKDESGNPTNSKLELNPIFTEEEIRSIVKGFVAAYAEGRVKIRFPVASTLLERAKKEGVSIDYKRAVDQELGAKEYFKKLIIDIDRGSVEEQNETIAKLFSLIISARSGGKIEGVFASSTIDERLARLEQQLLSINNLMSAVLADIQQVKEALATTENRESNKKPS